MLPVIRLAFFPQDATALLLDPHFPNRGNAQLDVLHYALHLRLDPARQWISGKTQITARRQTTLAAATAKDIHTFFSGLGPLQHHSGDIPKIRKQENGWHPLATKANKYANLFPLTLQSSPST